MDVLLIGNDQTLLVQSVTDEITGSYINDATVTASLRQMNTTAVPGQSWPLTLDYVAASNGNYRGNLENDLEIREGLKYIVEITIVSGSFQAFFRFERRADYRRA